MFPLSVAERELRRLKHKLSNIEFALDWVQGNLDVEIKKSNPNAMRVAIGFNIGDTYTKRNGNKVEKVVFIPNNKVAIDKLVEEKNSVNQDIAKISSRIKVQS